MNPHDDKDPLQLSPQDFKLLLAEDEPVQRRLFCRTLMDQGYQVETAKSGDEALERVLRGGVQILLTDWDMPGMDGPELCRRIRRARLEEYVYILMITSHQSRSDMMVGFEVGANDYIRKPLDRDEVLARLHSACQLVSVQTELRTAKITDPLVRCFNRCYLNEQLPRAVAHARRHGDPLALAMVDIDFFKSINDRYQHMGGDEVLRGFVQRTQNCLRPGDWIARFGGEEFAIVLPKTSGEEAHVAAERIRQSCAADPFTTWMGRVDITVSLGVASLLPSLYGSPSEVNDLVARADAALYRSKEAGRNRVTTAGERLSAAISLPAA